MSMTVSPLTEGARRPGRIRPAASFKEPAPRNTCTHPLTFGVLATISAAPFILSRGRVGLEAVLQPVAMGGAGWLGASCAKAWPRETRAMGRFLGATLGAATAAAVAHAIHDLSHCDTSFPRCLAKALFDSAAGVCGALLGGTLGGSAWSGRNNPMGEGRGVIAAVTVGAYALSGLGMLPLGLPNIVSSVQAAADAA